MALPNLNRRTLLKAAGVSVALPLLESFASTATAKGSKAVSGIDEHIDIGGTAELIECDLALWLGCPLDNVRKRRVSP